MDYEVQYSQTTEYVEKVYAANSDILDIYHCCVPFKVQTCTSMFQQYWRPWSEEYRDIWVREMPHSCLRAKDFDFFKEDMWDYDFQNMNGKWAGVYVALLVSVPKRVLIGGGPYIVIRITEN